MQCSAREGNREQPLSKQGRRQIPPWNCLVAAEPSFVSRGRCANNLQHCSPKLRIMQQCDSDGASGTTSVYTGIHTVPRLSHRGGGGGLHMHWEHRVSLYLSAPFPISSLPFCHPVSRATRSFPLTGKDRTMEQIVCCMFYGSCPSQAHSRQNQPSTLTNANAFAFLLISPHR